MHILLITSAQPGSPRVEEGGDRDHARQLAQSGHDVTVLSVRLLPLTAWRGPAASREQHDGWRRVRIDLPAVGHALHDLEQRIGVRLVTRTLASLGVGVPDVVHAPIPAAVLAKELGIRWGRPYLVTGRRPGPPHGTPAEPSRAVMQAVKDAAVVVTADQAVADGLSREYARMDVEVLASGTAEADVDHCCAVYERAREVSRRPRMIFHAPYPIDPDPTSASRLRPLKMLQAFRELGFQVHEITGNPRDRATGFRDARRRRQAGQDISLLYSENSTQPNLFSTSIRTGLAPLLEARIFTWARHSGIPAGEFYRDIYWKFSTRLLAVRTLRGLAMQLAYRADLAVLRRSGVHLFLPSTSMGPEIPFPPGRYSALPPGTVVRESATPEGIHLFYVGGLGDDYGLHACVEAVAATPGTTLTMCVPERAWERYGADYAEHLGERIRVVHASSQELAPFYEQASACVLFVEPTPYRRFAAPVKFFEYLGYGKPILLSEGTLAGTMGSELGIGLEIPYSVEDFARTLQELVAAPQRLQQMAARAQEARHRHTWQERAIEAVTALRPDLPMDATAGRRSSSPRRTGAA